ncbi:MAG: hypothetical protein GF308_01540 [Candidatus Heimdallarchaeota archaeon]|nr:hypothetical protein [Candidatus Heimdallarchaeota archaeon]
MSQQIKTFFSRVWNEIDRRFSRPQVKREHLLLYGSLTLIIIGSFLLRILPYYANAVLLKGLDPWMQYRCALYINEHGLREFLNWYDQSTWYPWGRNVGSSMYLIIPVTAAILYKIALFLGINTTMLTTCFITPAIFGSLTVFIMYKLGSTIHSKRTGVIAAFFLSMSIGFMSRSIAGFFDNECIGIFLMFLTFYFFIKGYTKDSIVNSIFAGLSLGALSLTWGAYRYGYELLALYALLMIVLRKYSRRLFMSYSITISLGVLVSTLMPRNGIEFVFDAETLIPIAIIVVMLFLSIYRILARYIDVQKLKRTVQISTLVIIGLAIVGTIVLYALKLINPIPSKFLRTIFPTLAGSLPLIESVAENLPSSWSNLFYNIYIMIFMIPLGLYFCIKKPNEKTLFLFMIGLTGTYFGASMVRLSLIFAPAAALVTGYTLDEVLRPFALIFQERFTLSRRKIRSTTQIGRELIVVSYVFIAIMMMMTAIYGTQQTYQGYARHHELIAVPGKAHEYQQAYTFIRNHLSDYHLGEKPPVILSWWDYGYRIRTLGNTTVLVDNATINSTQIGIVGSVLAHNTSYSAKICKKFGVDYVLVFSPGLPLYQSGNTIFGQQKNDLRIAHWFVKIAERYAPEYGIVADDYYKEVPLDEGGGFQDKFWDSTVFKLCAYKLNKEGYADNPNQQTWNWRTYDLQDAPDVNTIKNFELVFQTQYCFIRIYRVL